MIRTLLAFSLALFASPGDVYELHQALGDQRFSSGGPSRSWADIQSDDHGVTEIGLERTGCMSVCPEYWATIHADGRFEYTGLSDVARKGKRTGRVDASNLRGLCQLICDSGYMDLDNTYSAGVDDLPSTYTTVVRNGTRKVIANNAGPTRLWAIEQVIDKLLLEAEWDEPIAPGPK